MLCGHVAQLLQRCVELLLTMLLVGLFFLDGVLAFLLFGQFIFFWPNCSRRWLTCWSNCMKVAAGSLRKPSSVSVGNRLANPLSSWSDVRGRWTVRAAGPPSNWRACWLASWTSLQSAASAAFVAG